MNENLKHRLRWARSAKDTIPLVFNSDNPILVYQMGKVGSTSIIDSLAGRWDGPVLHCHHIEFPKTRYIYNNHYKKNKPIYIISLTREPISRNISAFFQNLTIFTQAKVDSFADSTESLIQKFLDSYPHEMPLVWFQDHIERNFSINVFEHPFPESGYVHISRDNLHLLILRAEISDKLKEEAISSFLKMPNFKLTRSNVGSSKDYAKLYKNFKDSLILPQTYLDQMYDSLYFKHFYAGKIGVELSERWRLKTRDL